MKKIIFAAMALACASCILFTSCSDNKGKKSTNLPKKAEVVEEPEGEYDEEEYYEDSADWYGDGLERVYCKAYDGFVNVREAASFSAKKIGTFKNGPDPAEVLEDLGEWLHICTPEGVEGYIPSKFVQDTPTIAYTGSATASWLEGVWYTDGGYVLMIYNNGTWEWGYDYPVCYGTYIMQNNEVAFSTVWSDDSSVTFNETLPINKSANKLGTYEKSGGFMTEEEEAEGYGGYGCITQTDFKAAGKALLKQIESELY